MHASTLSITIFLLLHGDVDRGETTGTLEAQRINESSGVAASITSLGMFWTHNDSGDGPNLYLIDAEGRHQATWRVEGAGAIDWEDICSFRLDEKAFLAIADTGDNDRRRKHVSLYVVEEPSPAEQLGQGQSLKVFRRLDFTYRDGPDDCEAVGFDPVSRQFVIVTKRPSGALSLTPGPAHVYLLPLASDSAAGPAVLDPVARLPGIQVTAADVAPDGSGVLVLTYLDALWFSRTAERGWAEVFAEGSGRWIRMPPRRQGEAVCFEPDGQHVFLTSEGAKQPLWRRAAPSDEIESKDQKRP